MRLSISLALLATFLHRSRFRFWLFGFDNHCTDLIYRCQMSSELNQCPSDSNKTIILILQFNDLCSQWEKWIKPNMRQPTTAAAPLAQFFSKQQHQYWLYYHENNFTTCVLYPIDPVVSMALRLDYLISIDYSLDATFHYYCHIRFGYSSIFPACMCCHFS